MADKEARETQGMYHQCEVCDVRILPGKYLCALCELEELDQMYEDRERE